jgi:hypothetical protein
LLQTVRPAGWWKIKNDPRNHTKPHGFAQKELNQRLSDIRTGSGSDPVGLEKRLH